VVLAAPPPERLAGLPNDPLAGRLLQFAANSADPRTGFLPDQVDHTGCITRASRRCWPQTEFAKALLAEAESGNETAGVNARAVLARIFESYLTGCVPGGWHDQFDAAGHPITPYIPASTLYHLFLATAEATRVLQDSPVTG
jgi:mannose-6-phosphate isomerase